MLKKLNRYFRFLRLSIYWTFHKETRKANKVISKTKASLLQVDGYNIPNLSNFVLQGICVVDNDIFITAYDSKKEHNSKIMIFKDKELIHETYLSTKSHVGGICFDNINNIFWITDTSGTISGYDYKDIIKKKQVTPKYKKIKVVKDHINIYGNNAAAFITYHNNKIYVGNYNKRKYSAIIVYDIMKDGNINTDSSNVIKGLDFVQGITFYKNNNSVYLITSSSFLLKKSILRIYKYNDDIKDLSKEKAQTIYKLKPMLEQIDIDENGRLFAIFESNALKYKVYRINNNDVQVYENMLLLNYKEE